MTKKIKSSLKKLIKVNPYYLGGLATAVSLLLGCGILLSLAVGVGGILFAQSRNQKG
jgi:hypothetical protein